MTLKIFLLNSDHEISYKLSKMLPVLEFKAQCYCLLLLFNVALSELLLTIADIIKKP